MGKCTDTFIRVQTSFAPSSVTWWLDDDGHNGPWQFVTPAGPNSYEYPSCMFDNHFSLNLAPGTDWQGTVAVVTKEDFQNTIIIPNDEQWIVQGVEGLEIAGVPVQLRARFESGRTFYEHGCDIHGVPDGQVDSSEYPLCTSESISRASLVVRHVRFSNQRAPPDLYRTRYTWSVVPGTALGAVLRYTGGWGAKLIFQHCVRPATCAPTHTCILFEDITMGIRKGQGGLLVNSLCKTEPRQVLDHLWATTGNTFLIDGQMDEYTRPPFYDPTKTPEDLRMVIELSNSLVWENYAPYSGVRVVDVYPLNQSLIDNQFINNFALVSSGWNVGLYGGTFPDGHGLMGVSHHSYIRNEVSAPTANSEFKLEIGGFTDYIYRAPGLSCCLLRRLFSHSSSVGAFNAGPI